MEYMIGVGLAVAVCAFARFVGFDRDRVFYPTLVIVIATYYVLFAVIGGSMRALALESVAAGAFLALAVAGFKTNLWLVATVLVGHGVFDFFHHLFVSNPGVPVWWPGFCLSFDAAAGAFLGVLLLRSKLRGEHRVVKSSILNRIRLARQFENRRLSQSIKPALSVSHQEKSRIGSTSKPYPV